MVIMVSLTLFVVLGMVMAAMVIGRNAFNRRELQTAADALALASTYSLQQNGEPFQDIMARPYAKLNTRLPYTPAFTLFRNTNEKRAGIRVDLAATFDSEQTWYQRLFAVHVRSQAQVNELWFGERWPAISIVLDASDSMKYPILGGGGQPAFEIMRQVITAYAANTLPVRNGVVVFADDVVSAAAPPVNKVNNLAAINAALTAVGPAGRTNTRAALDRARAHLMALDAGRNVILITDGEPTLGGPCAVNEPCHFTVAETAGNQVRNMADAALFTVEIRRMNYTSQTTTFLRSIAGGPNTPGDDSNYHFAVQTALGVTNFIIGLTRAICAFGPLDPPPGALPDDARIRQGLDNLVGPPQRVFTFLREVDGSETRIPLVPNRDTQFMDPGFEYFVDPAGDAYVILTLNSCNWLGANGMRRVVARWDDAQLSPMPY